MFPSQAGRTPSGSDSVEKEPTKVPNPVGAEKVALEHVEDTVMLAPPKLTAEQERMVWRKIDRYPNMLLLNETLTSLSEIGNVGNAKLQGLISQLNLTGNRYNIALTMYFIPYCLLEFPANYPQLVVVRVLLGIMEAGQFPGAIYLLTLWYPRHMLQFRIALFYGGAGLAGAFSGLLAFGISFMSGTAGLLGWSWIFIVEGIVTVLVSVIGYFVMVDLPSTATFMTPEERVYIVWRKKYDNLSMGEEEHFELRHLWEAFTDWQVWLFIPLYLSFVTPTYGFALFLPSIINGFGFNTTISQLLTVPPYACAAVLLIKFAIWSDAKKLRSPFIAVGLAMSVIGFTLNIADVPIGVKYLGTFFVVIGTFAGFPGILSWQGNNMAGHYKRGIGMAITTSFANCGGIIASNIYRAQDAPHYRLGHGIELMFVGIGLLVLPVLVALYRHINVLHAKAQMEAEEKGVTYDAEEQRKLGDRAHEFRYTI
ncbi:hypothetical protein CERSUDRAFT_95905 [Gelatoporia subvermispora B]|uniref:Major facilitator superfamily (MFS) profile domain-containing protein n=1 Tax=Ceriporiopsis subvermispora (strain B) TaxID=914234 RepID=M2QWU6_CERS8|nr:hypothetical protein CERSUDRAFT_95905 [Gelatoporia subvermispora B]